MARFYRIDKTTVPRSYDTEAAVLILDEDGFRFNDRMDPTHFAPLTLDVWQAYRRFTQGDGYAGMTLDEYLTRLGL